MLNQKGAWGVIVKDSRVSHVDPLDVVGGFQLLQCDRCKHRSYFQAQYTSTAVLHFAKAGWRRISRLVHCPDCVAEIIPDEDMR